MTRLPNNYELKQVSNGGNYFKITEEAQEFRILTSPIIGYEYFAEKDGKLKPIRQKTPFTKKVKDKDGNEYEVEAIPQDSKDGRKPKEFRAFVVWNHTAKKIQIMELTQRVIMKSIVELTKSQDWSDPKQYDMSIYKTGQKLETKYTLTPLPKSRFESDEEWNNALKEAEGIRLEALYDGEDPFNPF